MIRRPWLADFRDPWVEYIHWKQWQSPLGRKLTIAAGAQGKPWFGWGYSFDPSAGDPRCIAFRMHVEHGQPAAIEMLVQLRKFDGSADAMKSIRFPWPA